MIRYSLKCDSNHDYDSWFQSSEAYLQLRDAGMLSCPICGSGSIDKAIMSPQVLANDKANKPKTRIDVKAPLTRLEGAIRKFRQEVEDNSENVGKKFAEEARAIHYGDAPERSIRGESHLEEARSLVEEGISVIPLPWSDHANTH